MSKFLNISTDTTLGGNSASDDTVSSQKAVKAYVDSQTGTAPAFANITGQPTDNANLATALAGKVPTSRTINSKALTSDITLTASDVGALPDSTVIPTVNNATLTIQKNGTTVNTFTANASSNVTANITVPTKTSDLTNDSGFITGITSSDVTTALGYTPADDSGVVKTTGNQTIAGIKTFTSTPFSQKSTASDVNPYADFYSCKDTGINYKTNPSINKSYYPVLLKDSNNQFMTWNEATQHTDGSVSHVFKARTRNTADTANIDGEISLRVYRNGSVVTYAPTPATSDNSTKIATTAFVKSNLSSKPNTSDFEVIHCVVETYQNGTDWYRVYDDGWVEQGGFYKVTTSSPHTISLLKEMSDVNYTILGIAGMGSQGDATLQISIRTDMITTTTFGVQKQWTNISGSYYWYVCGMGV